MAIFFINHVERFPSIDNIRKVSARSGFIELIGLSLETVVVRSLILIS